MQGVVGFLNNNFTAYLPRNLSMKKFRKTIKMWQNYGHEFVAFGPTCIHGFIT